MREEETRGRATTPSHVGESDAEQITLAVVEGPSGPDGRKWHEVADAEQRGDVMLLETVCGHTYVREDYEVEVAEETPAGTTGMDICYRCVRESPGGVDPAGEDEAGDRPTIDVDARGESA